MNEKNVSQDTLSTSNSTKELNIAFYRLNALLHSLTGMLSAETKLSLSELIAAEHLRLDGSLTAKEVAHRVQMGSGATTALLDRLEKRGLVKRAPHPTDRRSIMVHYAGQREQQTPNEPKLARFTELLDARIGGLEPTERDVVTAFLKGVASDIEDVLK